MSYPFLRLITFQRRNKFLLLANLLQVDKEEAILPHFSIVCLKFQKYQKMLSVSLTLCVYLMIVVKMYIISV